MRKIHLLTNEKVDHPVFDILSIGTKQLKRNGGFNKRNFPVKICVAEKYKDFLLKQALPRAQLRHKNSKGLFKYIGILDRFARIK